MTTTPSAIVRWWSARATAKGAEAYRLHFDRDVRPRLQGIAGQRGALVLQRGSTEVELFVLTFWESMDVMRTFAGPDPTVAVVAAEAQAVLTDYDREVKIFEAVLDDRR